MSFNKLNRKSRYLIFLKKLKVRIFYLSRVFLDDLSSSSAVFTPLGGSIGL